MVSLSHLQFLHVASAQVADGVTLGCNKECWRQAATVGPHQVESGVRDGALVREVGIHEEAGIALMQHAQAAAVLNEGRMCRVCWVGIGCCRVCASTRGTLGLSACWYVQQPVPTRAQRTYCAKEQACKLMSQPLLSPGACTVPYRGCLEKSDRSDSQKRTWLASFKPC